MNASRCCFAVLTIALTPFVAWSQSEAKPRGTFRVAGYLPDYRFAEFDAAAARRLTDLLIFSAEPTAEGQLNVTRLASCPWESLRQLQQDHAVRLTLTLGGWGRSEHFPVVAQSPERRDRLVAAVQRLCTERQLNGIDLDWEHPRNDAAAQDYGRLLEQLHRQLAPRGIAVSVTLAAWQPLTPLAISSVDWVQVMSYDHDDRHATFEQSERDIDRLLHAGVPARQLVLGLPFYGRHRDTRDTLTYRDLRARFRPAPDVDLAEGWYFNGPQTIGQKVRWAQRQQLGGVMVWELGQDAAGDAALLNVVDQAVHKK